MDLRPDKPTIMNHPPRRTTRVRWATTSRVRTGRAITEARRTSSTCRTIPDPMRKPGMATPTGTTNSGANPFRYNRQKLEEVTRRRTTTGAQTDRGKRKQRDLRLIGTVARKTANVEEATISRILPRAIGRTPMKRRRESRNTVCGNRRRKDRKACRDE